jgi:hypothetical protein
MLDWSQILNTVVGLVLAALLSALILWGVSKVRGLIWKRPDFILHRRAAGHWELERVKRSPAYRVIVNTGRSNTHESELSDPGGQLVGDVLRGTWAHVDIGGTEAWFSWIDGRRRWTRSITVEDDVKDYPVIAERPRKDGRVIT